MTSCMVGGVEFEKCLIHTCKTCGEILMLATDVDSTCKCGDWEFINHHKIFFAKVEGRIERNDEGEWLTQEQLNRRKLSASRGVKARRFVETALDNIKK